MSEIREKVEDDRLTCWHPVPRTSRRRARGTTAADYRDHPGAGFFESDSSVFRFLSLNLACYHQALPALPRARKQSGQTHLIKEPTFMAEGAKGTASDVYVLGTGETAADRLRLLDEVYGPSTRKMLLDAGLGPGTRALDLACGIGAVSCWMATQV